MLMMRNYEEHLPEECGLANQRLIELEVSVSAICERAVKSFIEQS